MNEHHKNNDYCQLELALEIMQISTTTNEQLDEYLYDEDSELNTVGIALFDAIDNDDIEKIRLSILYPLNLSQYMSQFGYTPLEYAVEKGSLKSVEFLISTGIDIDVGVSGSPLSTAVTAKRADIVLTLLKAGANANLEFQDDWTILMSAITVADINLVKALVKYGANINTVNCNGETALTIAKKTGHIDKIEYLIGVGAIEIREEENFIDHDEE
jgi:ankyrin repeat protein